MRAARLPRPSPSDRRQRIAAGLDWCIRKRGYAEASLTDVANAAGMSPSHVLYYFDGKPAVLEYHFQHLCESLLEEVRGLAGKSSLEQIEGLTGLFFGGAEVSSDAVGVYLEIFGVAVHSERVRTIKADWDRAMRSFFAGLFAATPRAEGLSAEAAAELAFALLMGLRTNAYFDGFHTPGALGRSREAFRGELLRLAGLTSPTTSPTRRLATP
jgi:AcrR family transcriptional regulator